MGVVSKLTELAKVKLILGGETLRSTPQNPKPSSSTTAGGLTAEQLIEALETAQKRGIRG